MSKSNESRITEATVRMMQAKWGPRGGSADWFGQPAASNEQPATSNQQPPPLPRWPMFLPIKVLSEANRRDKMDENKRKAHQKTAIVAYLARYRQAVATLKRPVTATLTAMTPPGQKQMDPDNLGRAFKAVQDQIAESLLGCDDGDRSQVLWKYAEGSAAEGAGMLVDVREAQGATNDQVIQAISHEPVDHRAAGELG